MSCATAEVNEVVQTSLRQLLITSPKLKRFEITGRGLVFDHFVLDESILSLLPNSIRDLSISAGGSLKITNLNFLRGKLYLYLGSIRELSDESLLVICFGCPRLLHLSLDNCSLLSSNSLSALGNLFDLEWLCLAGVSGVDDFVLERLSNCRQLQTLDIKYCRRVTKVGLMIVLELPVLFRLEVQGVRAYSKDLLPHAKRVPKTILSDYTDIPVFIVPPLPSAVVG
ncbi:hypothetical protein KIN20_027786 [Parelaphostrongylus tenuis]|uniref:Uncharacterized protein n=1 Tax=Parelaphostrongylus tenuis TaxID=148309 RepID=A0AAD5WE26_PARTN|nr:hypothetical protein KIN20_027786 [Parelaphostrongylus tenuis]